MKKEIFGGRYAAGEKILPIREFAAYCSVNPNTVAKAYAALEEEKLIYTDSTLGKFVTPNRLFLQKKREEYLEAEMEAFKAELKKCGVDEEEFVCLAKKC
ncbi:MAG: GntR family transcriptional regulator [Clostridia bacterium]|nr:GntR family transcriptional regulator [Clostridia bacterium]